MKYEGAVFRPPSEAYSLIIQLTIGCAHNECTFCYMYKGKAFRVRPIDEVIAEMREFASQYPASHIRRIFLADGDALVVKTDTLLELMRVAKELFPNVERFSTYSAPKDILAKSDEDLQKLRDAGLTLFYLGLESGDDVVLRDVKKGVTAAQMIEAGTKVRRNGIGLSMMIISGLGGQPRLREHAIESAKVVSAIKPEYLGFLTLRFFKNTPMYQDYVSGKFVPISTDDIMEEMKLFLSHVDSEGTIFRANHASNFVPLAGTLNKDKAELISLVDMAKREQLYRKEVERGF